MKHTPGPWKLVKKTTPGQFGTDYQIRTDENYMIAEIGPNSQDANAFLIAAAPDLLEALEQIKGLLNDGEDVMQTLENIVDHAISMARGRQ